MATRLLHRADGGSSGDRGGAQWRARRGQVGNGALELVEAAGRAAPEDKADGGEVLGEDVVARTTAAG